MLFDGNKRQLGRIERTLGRIYILVLLIFLRGMVKPKGKLKLGLILLRGEVKMANDPVVLNSDQKELISVAPIKPDGSPDPDVDVSFSSSDPSVGIEEQADGRSAFILTPASSGAAVISVQAEGYDSEELAVSYAPLAKGKLNLSVGQPISDL